MSANLNAKGGIAPFTGAGPVPSTPPMLGQPPATPPATPAAPTAAPAGSSWIGQLAPGTTYDASTRQATVPLPWGNAPFDPSAYPIVNGKTMVTPQQFSDFLATAPYNPASAVNPQSVTDWTQMLQGIMAPVTTAQNAQNQQQLQSYQDAINSQVAQATQGVNNARTNLQTDQSNAWQSAASSGQGRGVGGALSAYEQGKVSKAYAPQFANLEAGLATDLTSIHNTAADAIKSMSLAGQTEQAQQTAGLAQDAISFLQSSETVTAEDRTAMLNLFQDRADKAQQNQQFEETLKQKTQYDQGMVTAAQERAADAPGTANNPSATQLKQQTDQATGQAETAISGYLQSKAGQYQLNAEAGKGVTAYRKQFGHDPSTADMQKIQAQAQLMALQDYLSQNTGQYTSEGIDPSMLTNYAYQQLGLPQPYKGATADQSATPTSYSVMTDALKIAMANPDFSSDTAAQQQQLISQAQAQLQNALSGSGT